MCQSTGSSWLVQIMTCQWLGIYLNKHLTYCQLCHCRQTSLYSESKYNSFHSRECFWKYCLQNVSHFVRSLCVNPSGAELEYSGMNRSIPRLLMTLLLKSPGHQQPCYWLCKINMSIFSTMMNFNVLHHTSIKKWQNIQIYFYVS